MGCLWAWSAIWREYNHRHWEESKTSNRGQCSNQQGVGYVTRSGEDNWGSTYFKIFWKSWKWSSYRRKCWLYWLHWHLVVEMSSLTVKRPKYKSQMLANGPYSQVSSGSGSTQNQTITTGLTTRKTRTIRKGPVLPPKTRHFKFTIFAPIKYLSSDSIATWSICRLCIFRRSVTSHIQICDWTNIHCVTVKNPGISLKMYPYFTASQWIPIESQIWMLKVKELI